MIGRLVTTLATVGVAIVLALAVPVSQLRFYTVETNCCCPDPDDCHCLDHDLDAQTEPDIRVCHKSQQAAASTPVPTFDRPALIALAPMGEPTVDLVIHARTEPHPAPPPKRPDAPS